MGDSLSLECYYAVSCARCAVALRCAVARRSPSLGGQLGGQLGGLAGRGRLKAPHIALPGYHNDSP